MTQQRPLGRRRWLRVLVGVALVTVPVVAVARTREALVANHPAYPAALVIAFAVGLLMIFTGLRNRTPPRRTPAGRIERGAAAIGGLVIAGLLLWLQPAVATERALDALASDDVVTITDSRTQTVYEPLDPPKAGLVLYPGAKVDPRAYAVIARGIAEGGYRVVVPKCAFDLALTCENVAQRSITANLPWAVGGHSLGGVAASTFAAGGSADGLLLLASYPVTDLSATEGLSVVSISGTEDGLSTPADIAEHKDRLPPGTTYLPIKGAIHAHFGDYGPQRGDGTPTITREQAQRSILAGARGLLASLAADQQR